MSATAAGEFDRLREMPREQRVHLDNKLREFDALNRGEQAAVRTLDETLNGLPEGDRADHYAVMRRYHLWLQTLTDAQRSQLGAAPPEKRLRVAERLRAEQRASNLPTPMLFQVAEFGGVSPYDLASRIKVWLKLTPAEKAEVAKLQEEPRRRRMAELARTLKITPVPEPAISEEQARAILERATKKAPALDQLLKREEEKKKGVRRRRVLESYYLLDHPPEKVKPENLVKFDSALPPWIRGTIDPLSPDAARRRLSTLYRLVFPAPQEIDPPRPATAAKKGQTPVTKKGGPPPDSGTSAKPTAP